MLMNYSPQYTPTLLDTRGDHLQAEWRVWSTLWEALGWDTLRSAAFYRCTDLVGCVLVPIAVGRGALWTASSSLRRAVPQALTLLGEARFIARRLKCLFLEECRRSPSHFWSRRGCLGFGICILYICSLIVIYLFQPTSLVGVSSFWPLNTVAHRHQIWISCSVFGLIERRFTTQIQTCSVVSYENLLFRLFLQ